MKSNVALTSFYVRLLIGLICAFAFGVTQLEPLRWIAILFCLYAIEPGVFFIIQRRSEEKN